MKNHERCGAQISPSLFREGIRVLASKSTAYGAKKLLREDGWGMLDETKIEPGTSVGREGIIRGKKDGVTHDIRIRLFNAAAQMNRDHHPIADIRVYAAEEEVASNGEELVDTEGKGVLRGLIGLEIGHTAIADFDHGTAPSITPGVQGRLEELVGAFGLPSEVITESHQWFVYDDGAFEQLIINLPHLT